MVELSASAQSHPRGDVYCAVKGRGTQVEGGVTKCAPGCTEKTWQQRNRGPGVGKTRSECSEAQSRAGQGRRACTVRVDSTSVLGCSGI